MLGTGMVWAFSHSLIADNSSTVSYVDLHLFEFIITSEVPDDLLKQKAGRSEGNVGLEVDRSCRWFALRMFDLEYTCLWEVSLGKTHGLMVTYKKQHGGLDGWIKCSRGVHLGVQADVYCMLSSVLEPVWHAPEPLVAGLSFKAGF